MSEKRFTMVCMGEDLVELNDNGIYKVFNDTELEKLLNELHEENIQLKERNEFLKKQLDSVCIDNEIMRGKLNKLEGYYKGDLE